MQDDINYPALIDTAMRGVVRDALKQVKIHGLPGEHHFFISYRTDFPGVAMSDSLRARYPKEITIVMQHQYWDLTVDQDRFSITLSFNNVPEKLTVPFEALTAFADPSVKFGLQFNVAAYEDEGEDRGEPHSPLPVTVDDATPKPADDGKGAEVISLDKFRKK